MRILSSAVVLFVATVALWACKLGDRVCAGVGYDALRLTIRDELGNAQALGATAILNDGTGLDPRGLHGDSLTLQGGDDDRTYDILVTKPWYSDELVRGVHTPYVGCYSGQGGPPPIVTVAITLHLAAGAPAVRSVHLMPDRVTLDRFESRNSATFTPVTDVNPGVSREVRWSISGDTNSVLFERSTGKVIYKCLPLSGYLTLIATSAADSSVFGTASVAVQGHPAAINDPPCS
jgi:hypothetical protein